MGDTRVQNVAPAQQDAPSNPSNEIAEIVRNAPNVTQIPIPKFAHHRESFLVSNPFLVVE